MDIKYELEMRALHKYLERMQRGEVTGAEPFHVIVNLMGKASDIALKDARRTLIDERKRAVNEGDPFPLSIEGLISGASQEGLLEVSRIFAEDHLVVLGFMEEQEQQFAAEAFHEKYTGERHLQLV